MNYRHAYHAGNFADCFKHALFLLLLRAMQRKDKPFLVLDTHAGIGRYDLTAGPAAKTAEWQSGIAKLLDAKPPALADYLALVETLGLYPGSPAIAAFLRRDNDRLVCCELHPEDAAALKTTFAGQRQIAVHQRDGYAALKAFLPPPEKRGLVLLDPPFERDDEFSQLMDALQLAHERFPAGIYAAWYPIKTRAPVRDFLAALQFTRLRDVIAVEFLRRPATDPARLNGCGLLIVNPPYGFEVTAPPILQSLCDILGEADASYAIERVIDE
jgi:23S rRNA (adenine2030-N6)-methyltransferase